MKRAEVPRHFRNPTAVPPFPCEDALQPRSQCVFNTDGCCRSSDCLVQANSHSQQHGQYHFRWLPKQQCLIAKDSTTTPSGPCHVYADCHIYICMRTCMCLYAPYSAICLGRRGIKHWKHFQWQSLCYLTQTVAAQWMTDSNLLSWVYYCIQAWLAWWVSLFNVGGAAPDLTVPHLCSS